MFLLKNKKLSLKYQQNPILSGSVHFGIDLIFKLLFPRCTTTAVLEFV